MGISLLALFQSMGGFAKGIVLALAIMSVYSLTVMVQKWWTLRKAQAETRKFAPEFSQFLEEDNLNEAIRLAESYKKSHVARVLGGALGEVKPLLQDGSVTVADINSAERAVERNMMIILSELKRGLAVLATVGATAPFVGLLGTVIGIYHALIAIGVAGQASIDKVAGPVGEALIMTAIGLAVAVPAVLGYNILLRRNKGTQERVSHFTHELHAYLISGAKMGLGMDKGPAAPIGKSAPAAAR